MDWKDDYSVKVGKWNNHHKKIIDAINELQPAEDNFFSKTSLEKI